MDPTPETREMMLFTNRIEKSPIGGRELLCKLNHDILKDIYGERLTLFEIPKQKIRGTLSTLRAFRGEIDGLNGMLINSALDILRRRNIRQVFVDGSGFGRFVSIAKRDFPNIEIITFFHNVEAKFFLGSLQTNKSVRSLAVLIVNYLAERKAVQHSNKRICLSERDSQVLQKLYGRTATHISAMAVRDADTEAPHSAVTARKEPYILFVGGGFYANRTGIQWFFNHVAPRVEMTTYAVGRGLEDVEGQHPDNNRVVIVGAVESLADWYRNAQFVIAPIFSGSGMKTKVAEALMFGKKIIGTPEAFSGYEDIAAQVGWECISADDFVAAIAEASQSIVECYDPQLREIYKEKYSYSAARSRLADILSAH
jgi:glycosyltransferase involved in cell wall biosynthesis